MSTSCFKWVWKNGTLANKSDVAMARKRLCICIYNSLSIFIDLSFQNCLTSYDLCAEVALQPEERESICQILDANVHDSGVSRQYHLSVERHVLFGRNTNADALLHIRKLVQIASAVNYDVIVAAGSVSETDQTIIYT